MNVPVPAVQSAIVNLSLTFRGRRPQNVKDCQSAIGLVPARMGSGTSPRELRIGRLDSILTVAPT